MSSPIDDLFEQIFGFKTKKAGTAYEMLCAAAFKIIDSKVQVLHDERMKGEFSNSNYQIDLSINDINGSKKMGEAKDYTKQNKVVGRGDLQKLGGALGDLNVEGGIFFSATDYTKDAKQYAQASKQINNKGIELYHLREVTEKDKDGYILGFNLIGEIYGLDWPKTFAEPRFTQKCSDEINNELKIKGKKQYNDSIEYIFDKDGNKLESIWDISSNFKDYKNKDFFEVYYQTPNRYIYIEGKLREITSIYFKIPVILYKFESIVSIEDNIKLTIESEDKKTNYWITDTDLKKIKFLDNGEAIIQDNEEVA